MSTSGDAPPPAKKPRTEVVQSAISAVAAVIGGRVSQCLDTESPRRVTYSVTSKPLRYVDEDNGEPLHGSDVTESFHLEHCLAAQNAQPIGNLTHCQYAS
jgi:hypothetical protein